MSHRENERIEDIVWIKEQIRGALEAGEGCIDGAIHAAPDGYSDEGVFGFERERARSAITTAATRAVLMVLARELGRIEDRAADSLTNAEAKTLAHYKRMEGRGELEKGGAREEEKEGC